MPQVIFGLSKKHGQKKPRKEIAQTFTAYLIGSSVFNLQDRYPAEQQSSLSQDRWILDMANDFKLLFEADGTVHLICRHEGQVPVIKAAVALFKVNHVATTEVSRSA